MMTVEESLKSILENHLPSLEQKIVRLDERVKLILWVLGVVSTLIIASLFK